MVTSFEGMEATGWGWAESWDVLGGKFCCFCVVDGRRASDES